MNKLRPKHYLFCFVSVVFIFNSCQTMGQQRLDQFGWKNRIILIHDGGEDSLTERHVEAFSEKMEGVKERDLLIFVLHAKDESITEIGKSQDPGLSYSQIVEERQIPKDSFYFLLIGKDGSTKMKESKEVEVQKVFDKIDAMPMRQAEIRRQDKD